MNLRLVQSLIFDSPASLSLFIATSTLCCSYGMNHTVLVFPLTSSALEPSEPRAARLAWRLMVLEICVDSVDSAVSASNGGADRLELCSDLLEGGITPSAGLIRAVRDRVAIEMYVMIRPRGGDFVYSDCELDVMAADILEAKQLGVDGVVLGLLTSDGSVDMANTARLVELAAPLPVTFHRAIDMSRNIEAACEDIISCGAHRILTSGGRQTAQQGAATIAELVKMGASRVRIMAGSGIRPGNVAELAKATGAQEFHASLRKGAPSPVTYRNEHVSMGSIDGAEFMRYHVLEADVAALREALDKI